MRNTQGRCNRFKGKIIGIAILGATGGTVIYPLTRFFQYLIVTLTIPNGKRFRLREMGTRSQGIARQLLDWP